MITGRPIGIQEDRVFVDLIFKVNSKNIFNDGKTKKSGAVVSSMRNKWFNVKNFAPFSKLRFIGNGVSILVPVFYKPSCGSGTCKTKIASSESEFWWVAFYWERRGTTYSFVILASIEPSSHSRYFMAFTKIWPVVRASMPFWSSLISSMTNKILIWG